jgi:predicted nucleic acid-binding protein
LNSVLLDTSFLISLSDPTRPHHTAAVQYYRECIRKQIPMFLSAIAISEFHVKQSINDLELRNFIVLPFNVDHAMACGLFLRDFPIRDADDDRVRVKDDFKLLAQCQCEGITHLLTEDRSTLAKYLARLRDSGRVQTQSIELKAGFDLAWFNSGQKPLEI